MDVFKLLWKGSKKALDFSDLWELEEKFTARTLYHRFINHWRPRFNQIQLNMNEKAKLNNEITDENGACQAKITKRIANILPSLWITTRKLLIISALLEIGQNCLAFAAPQILDYLIAHVTPGSMEDNSKGYIYVGLLFIVISIKTICYTYEAKLLFVTGIQLQSMLSEAVYQKSLLISNIARKESTFGQIINLMSVDSQVFHDGTLYIHDLWSGPLIILLAFYFLWKQLRTAALAGILVFFLLLPTNMFILAKFKMLKQSQLKKKDERIRLMNEILAGVKVLKLYAWEPAFGKRVERIRNHEISILRRVSYLISSENFILTLAPNLIALVSFGVYVLMDDTNVLNAQKVFVSLALFNMIRKPLSSLPTAFSHTVQMYVSLTRLNEFMNSKEINSDAVTHDAFDDGAVIRVEKGSFSWDGKGIETLRNINLEIKQGSLVAVVGSVGSGKSSLLSAILGEMERISGTVNTSGSIAYVSQQAWIRNATLRDNILFGKAFDPKLYHKIIKACALEPDFKIFRGGDKTEIGENGTNLSGGQKQRIALARAVYNQADIYLFDDPMSAVDVHVGRHIFKEVFGPKGLLRNKTRIMVTHGVTYLSQADIIIVMNDGILSESGTFNELLSNQNAFAEFLKQHIEPECMQANRISNKDIATESDLYNENLSDFPSNDFRKFSSDSMRGKYFTEDVGMMLLDKEIAVNGNSDPSKLVQAEVSEEGYIKASVYTYFLKCIGSLLVTACIILYTSAYGLNLCSNFWLLTWSKSTFINGTRETQDIYLGVYAGLTVGQAVATFLGNIFVTLGCLQAAQLLHNRMLGRVLRSPMSFFDTTPMGRIINRFSNDLDLPDNIFPVYLLLWMGAGYRTLNSILAITINSPLFVTFVIPVGFLFVAFQKFYTLTSNQLKRMESVSRSPLFSQFCETLTGVSTIRAFRAQQYCVSEFEKNVDKLQMVYYPFISTKIWFQIALEIFGNFVVLFTALFALLSIPTGGTLGLSISYALTVTFDLGVFVRQTVLLQGHLISIERIKSYTEIGQEADWKIPDKKLPPDWPQHGGITFKEFQLRYRDGLDLVVRRVDCSVDPAQKVGIVGRTGAGKSSLTLGLFRLMEAAGGSIEIDGKNISQLDVHDLRSRLTIIPQDPALFIGSLRFNLDPHNRYFDEAIWRALENAHLKTFVASLAGGLEHPVDENGSNFSVGQRQLLCLARALLRKTKILILDEATAAVDIETDDLIQNTIRSEFRDCTVLTIAHRLNTIMDYDRIMVLENGLIVEFDTPQKLLQLGKGVFYCLAVEAGLVTSSVAGNLTNSLKKETDTVIQDDGEVSTFDRENSYSDACNPNNA